MNTNLVGGVNLDFSSSNIVLNGQKIRKDVFIKTVLRTFKIWSRERILSLMNLRTFEIKNISDRHIERAK